METAWTATALTGAGSELWVHPKKSTQHEGPATGDLEGDADREKEERERNGG